jgi:hypothetical protein
MVARQEEIRAGLADIVYEIGEFMERAGVVA